MPYCFIFTGAFSASVSAFSGTEFSHIDVRQWLVLNSIHHPTTSRIILQNHGQISTRGQCCVSLFSGIIRPKNITNSDWIDQYQRIDPPDFEKQYQTMAKLNWKGGHNSLFNPRPLCTFDGEKQDGSLIVLYETLWLEERDLLIYWSPDLWIILIGPTLFLVATYEKETFRESILWLDSKSQNHWIPTHT